MSLPPDQPPLASKPKPTSEERRARQTDRLRTIRLRMAIGRELEERDITTPAEIGAALGMPSAEASACCARHQSREGDVALLEPRQPGSERRCQAPDRDHRRHRP